MRPAQPQLSHGAGAAAVTPQLSWKGPSLLHPDRFHLFTVVLALHTGSENTNKKVLSVSQTHPPTGVRGCSAHLYQKAMGKYRIQTLSSATLVYKKNGSSLTDRHLAGQQAEGYYASLSPPHRLKRVTWSQSKLHYRNTLVLQGGIRTLQVCS